MNAFGLGMEWSGGIIVFCLGGVVLVLVTTMKSPRVVLFEGIQAGAVGVFVGQFVVSEVVVWSATGDCVVGCASGNGGYIGGDLSWSAYDRCGLFWLSCVGVWLEVGASESACIGI